MCLSDCSTSCYRQNTTHLVSFGLRPTQQCFALPGFISPSPLVLERRSSARTVELGSYHFTSHCSSVWHAMSEDANPLRSALLGLPLSFRTHDQTYQLAPGLWPGRPTLRYNRRWWRWLAYMDHCWRQGREAQSLWDRYRSCPNERMRPIRRSEFLCHTRITETCQHLNGQGSWVRTSGLFVPNEALYQTELYPVTGIAR